MAWSFSEKVTDRHDLELVKRARARAFAIVEADPDLVAHPELDALLRQAFSGEAIEWLFHG